MHHYDRNTFEHIIHIYRANYTQQTLPAPAMDESNDNQPGDGCCKHTYYGSLHDLLKIMIQKLLVVIAGYYIAIPRYQ